MMGFIDQMRSQGHAVESVIRVLREQGVKIAARTYRAWKQGICRFLVEMAESAGDSTVVGGGFGVRIPREMADSYTPGDSDSRRGTNLRDASSHRAILRLEQAAPVS